MTAVAPVVPFGSRRASGVGVLAGLLTLAVTTIFLWQQGSFSGSGAFAADLVDEGNCVNVTGTNSPSFDVVPCRDPHNGEIVAVIVHPDADGPFPGDRVTKVWFEERCTEAADAYVGDDVMTTTLSARLVVPTEEDWADGQHRAVCYVATPGGESGLETSVLGRSDQLRRAGRVAISQLAAGDCFSPTDSRNPFELRSRDIVELADCSAVFHGIFFGRGLLPFPDNAVFPSSEELSTASTAVCSSTFEEFFAVESSVGYTFRFWRPSRTDWDSGLRDVLCAVLSEDEIEGQYVPADYPALGNLGTGQCFGLLPEQQPDSVSLDDHVRPVLCSDPHVGQMIGTGELPIEAGFPGEAEAQALTEQECRDRFETFVGIAPSESAYGRFPYWYPDQASWNSGDSRYACAILGDRILTESIQDSQD